MQHLVEKHSGKKRQESLLEAHQKELKKIKVNWVLQLIDGGVRGRCDPRQLD